MNYPFLNLSSTTTTLITTLSTTETTPTITNGIANANPENNEIKTAQDHRELLFEKLKKMDEESCVDPVLVKMLRETTSEPETTGKVWIVYYCLFGYGVSKLVLAYLCLLSPSICTKPFWTS